MERTGKSRSKSTNQGGRADARTRRDHQQPAKRGIATIYKRYEEIRSLEKENEDGKVARMTMNQRGWREEGERKERGRRRDEDQDGWRDGMAGQTPTQKSRASAIHG